MRVNGTREVNGVISRLLLFGLGGYLDFCSSKKDFAADTLDGENTGSLLDEYLTLLE